MIKVKYKIKFFDLIIIFWAFILMGGALATATIPLPFRIFFILSGIFFLGYLIYVIKIRADLVFELSREREISEEIESKIQDNEENPYRKIKQRYLEDVIEAQLIKMYPNARFIRNVYIPTSNNKRTEIDILMIHTSGIYMFEAKNYSAKISGNWSEENLIAEYKSGAVHNLANPILQNSNHFEYLKSVLGVNETGLIKNIVVFGSQAILNQEDIRRTKPNYANVFKLDELDKEINHIVSRSKISNDQIWVENTYSNINENSSITKEQKNMHIQNITKAHK